MSRLALAALLAAGCTSSDPCAGYGVANMICVGLDLEGPPIRFDTLHVGLTVPGHGNPAGDTSSPSTLPVLTRIEVPAEWRGSDQIQVFLYRGSGGELVGIGGPVSADLEPPSHAPLTIDVREVAPVDLGGLDLVGADLPPPGDLAGADLTVPMKGDFGTRLDLAGADLIGPLSCPMNAYLCDSFEGGQSNAWDPGTTNGMATLGVNGNRPNTGASSLEVDDGGGLSTSFAYYSFAFPNPPLSMGAVSARFYANFGTIPTGHYTAFAEFVGSAGLAAGPQLVTDDNGMGELWKLWVGDGMEKFDTIDKPLKVDHWYCMELSVDFAANGGAGAVWFSVDGAGVAVQPGVPPKAIDSFAFGLVNSPGAGPSTVYLDDVVIAPGGPIGCK